MLKGVPLHSEKVGSKTVRSPTSQAIVVMQNRRSVGRKPTACTCDTRGVPVAACTSTCNVHMHMHMHMRMRMPMHMAIAQTTLVRTVLVERHAATRCPARAIGAEHLDIGRPLVGQPGIIDRHCALCGQHHTRLAVCQALTIALLRTQRDTSQARSPAALATITLLAAARDVP
eukprot:7391901-Prymnesium_polylepis.2